MLPVQFPNAEKTDRDDARANFHYHASGLLAYVSVPDEHFEDAREYLRFRAQTSRTITRQKQRIQAMMKRQGAIYDLTVSYWTKKHYAWLKTVTLPTWTREVLNLKLLQLDQFEAQLMEVDRNLDRIFDVNSYTRVQIPLRSLYADSRYRTGRSNDSCT